MRSMLDIVTGQRRNVMATGQLVRALENADLSGTLYIGYPILSSADGTRIVEGLLTCQEHGVIAFDLVDGVLDGTEITERQNDLYTAVFQKLLSFKPLRSGRKLSVEVNVITLCPHRLQVEGDEIAVVPPDRVLDAIGTFDPITPEQLRHVNAAIQR